jgi:hypothetical protein
VDSGVSWMKTTAPNENWTSVGSSGDGTRLVAVVGSSGADGSIPNLGPIYTSTNSGATWRKTTAPINSWSAVASSADGTIIVAAVGYGALDSIYPGPVYTSTNSGTTWRKASVPIGNWSSVAASADGRTLVAVTSYDAGGSFGSGSIFISSNSGAIWTKSTAPASIWWSVASSADGKNLVALASSYDDFGNPSLIYVSADSGATWTQTGAPGKPWEAVASSADGSKIVSVANYFVGTLQLPIAPLPQARLGISPSGASLGISWLVPSSPFVLQQNSDLGLTNWTDVPTSPTLNFTNLNYQVSIQPSPDRRFFRLKQQ